MTDKKKTKKKTKKVQTHIAEYKKIKNALKKLRKLR